MSAAILISTTPIFIWLWRSQIVNLIADGVAAGIRKSKEPKP